MEGRINGRRGRGRPRTMWTDNIKEWTKISYNDCIRVAQDRERWRPMTADLLTADGTYWWWMMCLVFELFLACSSSIRIASPRPKYTVYRGAPLWGELYHYLQKFYELIMNMIIMSNLRYSLFLPLWIITPIPSVINLSLTEGSFPSHFKSAHVSPLLKKLSPKKDSMNNYRLVSNLSFLSKILEKAVVNHLNSHIQSLSVCI